MSTLALGTMTFGSEADEDVSHAQLDALLRGRRHPDRHRRRVQRRRLGGDHRALARQAAGRGTQPGRARHQGAHADGRRPERRRTLPAAPARRARRLAAAARGRLGGPLPGAFVRPSDSARRDARLSRRRRARRQDLLRRAVELHRLAGPEGRGPRRVPRPRASRDVAAAVQPARPGDRVGDRAGLRVDRAGAAAVVAARRRLADRQVHPGRAAERHHAARRGPRARHGGLRPPQHQPAHLGRDRGGPVGGLGARRQHGAGGARLGGRPADGELGDPRRAHRRAAAGQPRRGRRFT